MSRFLMWRLAAVSAAIFATALALALWLAHANIRREGQGAAQVALMLDHLGALESGPAADVPAHLAALRAIATGGKLRHLRLGLLDSQGRELIPQAAAPQAASPPRATSWTLQRGDGSRYRVQLAIDPGSERRESTTGILGMLAILLGYGGFTLLAVYAALRSALRPLKDILHAIAQYERSDYEHRLAPMRVREMNAIGQALNRMAETLARERDLRRALDLRMRRLREDERQHLARELHDEFGQNLAAMRADTAWLRRCTAGQPALRDVAAGLAERCERMQQGTRELLHRLRLPEQDGGAPFPLRRLLQELVEEWSGRPGQRTRFELRMALDEDLPGEAALAAYRLTQEALTNVSRHADASLVEIDLQRLADGRLAWSVRDDGVGIADPDRALRGGNGLAGMRERVWALHGEIEIGPARPGAPRPGLLLAARWPPAAGAIGLPAEPEGERLAG
jgi:two-component system sensor histidine kinase UhpB